MSANPAGGACTGYGTVGETRTQFANDHLVSPPSRTGDTLGELVVTVVRILDLRQLPSSMPDSRARTGTNLMQNHYTAVLKNDGGVWIGWIEEVPGVNCQEASREELIDTLRVTLEEALAFNRDDARSAAGDDFEEFRIAV